VEGRIQSQSVRSPEVVKVIEETIEKRTPVLKQECNFEKETTGLLYIIYYIFNSEILLWSMKKINILYVENMSNK